MQNKRFSLDDKLESTLITNAPYTTRKKIGLWGRRGGGGGVKANNSKTCNTSTHNVLLSSLLPS